MKKAIELKCKYCRLMMINVCSTSTGMHLWCNYCGVICFRPKNNPRHLEWWRPVLTAGLIQGDDNN